MFADPDDAAATELLAATYERLAYGAENATWRNFYLTGALELRRGVMRPAAAPRSLDLLLALSAEELFDSIAIRVDGPRAWDEHLTIDWRFTDLGRDYRTTLRNGVLVQEADPDPGDTDLTLTLTKVQLLALLGGAGFEGIEMAGDVGVLERLLALVDRGGAHFPIVTP